MEVEQADRRVRAYTALEALRSTLGEIDKSGPLGPFVMGLYVGQYDTALDHLEAIGENVRDYRVPDAAIREDLGGMVDSNYLLARVRAVLGYFTLRAAVLEQARETDERLENLIGFEVPQNR